MSMSSHAPSSQPPAGTRYLESASPIHFPEEAEVPETQRHLELRTALYQILQVALPEATVGSDQFVYYDASDPGRCVAPDVYVRLAPRQGFVGSWKIWERGAPEIAVEFVREYDRSERTFQQRLDHYRRLGVQELLRFDPDREEAPLRIWDRVEGALIEREVSGEFVPSSTSGLYWVVTGIAERGLKCALRVAHKESWDAVVPTPEGQEARARRQAEAQRDAERSARADLEARVKELEAKLEK